MGLCVGLDQRFVRWVAEKKKDRGLGSAPVIFSMLCVPCLH